MHLKKKKMYNKQISTVETFLRNKKKQSLKITILAET